MILCQNHGDVTMQTEVLRQTAKLVGLVRVQNSKQFYSCDFDKEYSIDLDGQGQSFFSILRDAEMEKLDALLFESLDEHPGGLGEAIIDRIKRAASR